MKRLIHRIFGYGAAGIACCLLAACSDLADESEDISQYVKMNSNQNKLDFYNENPDRNRNASQRNVVAEKQEKRQSKGQSI